MINHNTGLLESIHQSLKLTGISIYIFLKIKMRDILFRFGRYFASVDFNERRIIKMWFAYRAINIYEEFRK